MGSAVSRRRRASVTVAGSPTIARCARALLTATATENATTARACVSRDGRATPAPSRHARTVARAGARACPLRSVRASTAGRCLPLTPLRIPPLYPSSPLLSPCVLAAPRTLFPLPPASATLSSCPHHPVPPHLTTPPPSLELAHSPTVRVCIRGRIARSRLLPTALPSATSHSQLSRRPSCHRRRRRRHTARTRSLPSRRACVGAPASLASRRRLVCSRSTRYSDRPCLRHAA